jgi:hypothetical protein
MHEILGEWPLTPVVFGNKAPDSGNAELLCERAVSRYANGSTLAKKQKLQNWIADSTAQIRAARLMTLHAA